MTKQILLSFLFFISITNCQAQKIIKIKKSHVSRYSDSTYWVIDRYQIPESDYRNETILIIGNNKKKLAEFQFKKGQCTSETYFGIDGKRIYKLGLKDDRIASYETYYENEALKTREEFNLDFDASKVLTFDKENGLIIQTENWHEGQLLSFEVLNRNGILLQKSTLTKGSGWVFLFQPNANFLTKVFLIDSKVTRIDFYLNDVKYKSSVGEFVHSDSILGINLENMPILIKGKHTYFSDENKIIQSTTVP